MIITKKQIMKLMPCDEGWEWYLRNPEKDLLRLLQSLNRCHPDWASWVFTNLMTNKQCVQIAIFSAELVIGAYEFAHPDNKRPRDAINAAKDWLKNPTDAAAYAAHAANTAAHAAHAAAHAVAHVAHAAYAAAYAAHAAAHAVAHVAHAAYVAAHATNAAAHAADAAAHATNAAAHAAHAAAHTAADAASKKEIQVKIIKEAVRILEGTE